jgi:hypothetical protein
VAYPFGGLPTLRAFIEKARELGIEVKTSKEPAIGPRGEETFRYMQRPGGVPVILPHIAEDERLTHVVLANLCRRLDIPASAFGLTLGFIEDPFIDPPN